MRDRLSIRSYSTRSTSHVHDYHQLVIPLSGYIDIELGGGQSRLSAGLGDCVVIRSAMRHDFKASSAFRFLVADLRQLPPNLAESDITHFLLDTPALAFGQFIDAQLSTEVAPVVETQMLELFLSLIARQSFAVRIDTRIQKTLHTMRNYLDQTLSIEYLAGIACLSTTQFKTLFKNNMGMTSFQYLTKLRMERARALLTHSDLPVALIAEQVGFQDPSAFSRSFRRYFGQPPKIFQRQAGCVLHLN